MRVWLPSRLLVLFAALPLIAAALAAQAPLSSLPPVSWTCPMHPEVVDSDKGTCPICKMNLTPVRLESVWSCPVHAVVAEHVPGSCPICGRDLVQVTVALTWTCADHPEIDQIDPAKCPDGTPMIAKRTARAHGNHNPQHGGQFFMAPDNWHHLEGSYPRAGLFRLMGITGRVGTKEVFDKATRTTIEVSSFPLVMTADGQLEAKIDRPALPAQMSAKVRVKEGGPEYRFDFAFPSLSKEPVPPAVASAPPPAAAATPARTPPPPRPAPAAAPALADSSVVPLPIPETVDGMLAQLKMRNDQIRQLIDRGAFTDVWVAAFQAKDLAVALEAHSAELAADKREAAGPALASVVRTSWLLDAFGDLGNRQQLDDAYRLFASAVSGVEAAFGVR
jgi:hypothetical protein